MVEIVRPRDRSEERSVNARWGAETVRCDEVQGVRADPMEKRGGRDEMSKLREGVIHHKRGNCFELESIAIIFRFQVLQTCVLQSEVDG